MKAFFRLSNFDFDFMQRSPIAASMSYSQIIEASHLFQGEVAQVYIACRLVCRLSWRLPQLLSFWYWDRGPNIYSFHLWCSASSAGHSLRCCYKGSVISISQVVDVSTTDLVARKIFSFSHDVFTMQERQTFGWSTHPWWAPLLTCRKRTSELVGLIKSKSGEIIAERDTIKDRWPEYIQEL